MAESETRWVAAWPCKFCGWIGKTPVPDGDEPLIWRSAMAAQTVMDSHLTFHVDSVVRELYEMTEEA